MPFTYTDPTPLQFFSTSRGTLQIPDTSRYQQFHSFAESAVRRGFGTEQIIQSATELGIGVRHENARIIINQYRAEAANEPLIRQQPGQYPLRESLASPARPGQKNPQQIVVELTRTDEFGRSDRIIRHISSSRRPTLNQFIQALVEKLQEQQTPRRDRRR